MLFVVALLGLAPVALALVGMLFSTAIEALREKRRHARVLSDLGPPIAPAAAFGVAKREVVTIEGKLVALDASDQASQIEKADTHARLVSFHPYGTSFLDEVNVYAITHSSAQKGFAIELDGGAGRAILDGAMQVLRGAIETEHNAPLEKAGSLDAAPLGQTKVKQRLGQFRIVAPGDRVRARGAVEPAPDDDALYRSRSNVVRMTPAPTEIGEPKIALATTTSRQRRMKSRAGVVFLVLAASAVGGGGVVGVTTRTTTASGWAADAPSSKSMVSVPAQPACRAPAIASLARLDAPSPASCNDAYARALAHYAAGDFAEASKAFTLASIDPTVAPSLTEVEAHLFVHAYADASSVVRRMIDRFYLGPSTAEKQHLECIYDVLQGRAKRGADASGPRFVKVCALRPFAKLARQLDSDGHYRGEDDWPRPTFQNETRYDAVGKPYTAVVALRSRLAARPVALERDLVDRILLNGPSSKRPFGELERHFDYEAETIYPILTTWAAELALFYAYAGFPERAAPYWPILDRVATVVEKGQSFHEKRWNTELEKEQIEDERTLLVHVLGIGGAAALWANDAARLHRYTAVGEPYTSQAARQMARVTQPSSVWEDPVVDRTWPESKAIFDAADKGSAAEVARLLGEQKSTGRSTLPRALPRLGADRSALQTWFHSDAYPAACLTCGASTFLGDLSDRREIARLLGDTTTRDRLKTSAERFTTALTDPEIGFELDELETFFSTRK